MSIKEDFAEITKTNIKKSKNLSDGLGQSSYLNKTPCAHFSQEADNEELILSPLFEIYEVVSQDIQTRGTEPKYRTGLKELDEILWGLHKKELMVIGARTSMGKTALALQLAKNLADTHCKVVYFSLEMSKEQLTERLLCNFCRINATSLRQGGAKSEVAAKENVFKEWINDINLLIEDRYGFNFTNIVKICKIIKPDFVFVDYIQLVSAQGYKSKREAIDEYLRSLKQLTQEMNFGAVVLSQINRMEKDNPSMSGFKESGTLEEHPDSCLVLYWNFESDEYKIMVQKQRHGCTGNVQVKFLPQFSCFEDYIYAPKKEKDFYK